MKQTNSSFSSWKYKTVFEESLDGILMIEGESGLILTSNPAVENFLGYKKSQLEGSHFSDYFPPGVDWADRLKVQGTVFSCQPFRHFDGTVRPLDVTAKLLSCEEETVILLNLRDAVERMAAEQQIEQLNRNLEARIAERTEQLCEANRQLTRQLEEISRAENAISLLKRAMDHALNPLFIADASGDGFPFIYANPAFRQMTGRAPEEEEKEPGTLLQAVLDELKKDFESGAQLTECRQISLEIAELNRPSRWIDLFLSPMRENGGELTHYIGILNDVSVRKKLEVETLRALTRERDLNELKSNFISTVSHEFRTPLGIILSAAGILEKYGERIAEQEKKEHLAEIHAAVHRMARLMEDVLWLGKSETAKVVCQPKPIPLSAFCRSIVDEGFEGRK